MRNEREPTLELYSPSVTKPSKFTLYSLSAPSTTHAVLGACLLVKAGIPLVAGAGVAIDGLAGLVRPPPVGIDDNLAFNSLARARRAIGP